MIWPRRTNFALLLLFAAVLISSLRTSAQEYVQTGDRKVVNRIMPQYPPLARSMHLSGVVKVEAVVSSNGVVKNVSVKGGHPLLVQSATDAVRKWKWESSSHESTESVEVKFNPE